MDGPARGTGGLAGRGMDGAAGMEGVSSLTGTGVLGVLMVRGNADCAGTDERRVGMQDVRGARLRRGRVEMDSPGAVIGTAGADVMGCRVSMSSESLSLSLSAPPVLLPLLLASGEAGSWISRILWVRKRPSH